MSSPSTKALRHERLLASRCYSRYAFDERWTVLTHIVPNHRVACDRVALRIFDWFRRPGDPAAVATACRLTRQPERVAEIVELLRNAQLLQPVGTDERAQIRAVFARRFLEPPDDQAPVTLPTLGASPSGRTGLELAADVPLVLSDALAQLALPRGEMLVTHPASRRLHLTCELWQIASAFRRFATPATAWRRLRRDSHAAVTREQFEWACALLKARRLLWTSADEERELIARELRLRENAGLSFRIFQLFPEQHELAYRPYAVRDLRLVERTARVGVLGACHVQSYVPAFEHLAYRDGWHVEVRSQEEVAAEPRDADLAMLVLAVRGRARTAFYTLLAAHRFVQAARKIPDVVAEAKAGLDKALARTDAPILMHSYGRTGLRLAPHYAPEFHEVNRLLAELNHRLLKATRRRRRVYLLDEDAVVARHARGPFWDDAIHSSFHHGPMALWGMLPRGLGWPNNRGDGVRQHPDPFHGEVPQLPEGQQHPAYPFARAYLDFLRGIHVRDRVELIIFEPNELLWPDRLEDRAMARTPEQDRHMWVRQAYAFYSGLNEALSILKQAGVRLACVSSCRTEWLSTRWKRSRSKTCPVLNPGDLEFMMGGGRPEPHIADIIKRSGVAARNCLYINLGSDPPRSFAGRVYQGSKWDLRRYLLSAPELASHIVAPARSKPRLR